MSAGPGPSEPSSRLILTCGDRQLDCRPSAIAKTRAHVMGILNVTPDSFSDGGRYLHQGDALAQTERMLQDGAAIIDVGGESSRPKGSAYGKGADPVLEDEEKRRVLPVIEAIARRFPEALISIDTYKPGVALAALAAGAHIVNDITGLREFPETARVAAQANAPLIVMHSLGRPGAMPHEHRYDDAVAAVKRSLQTSILVAQQAGAAQLVVDPGFGFGKSVRENLRLIAHTQSFAELGYPVLVGISRKSTIGAVLGGSQPLPIDERLYGTLGATATAVLQGATLVRTHDVRPTVEMLALLAATQP
ncbi:MAG: dihydropteroate synthase [Elainellaceae cyanobacterium]